MSGKRDVAIGTEDEGSERQALRLAAAVARRHYVDDRSKIEIAAEFGLSRFKVARLLERARAEGLVRIEVCDPYAVDERLSRRLRDVLGIERSLVLGAVTDARTEVGALAARHLRDVVEPGGRLGIAWSRSTQALVEHLHLRPCTVVQLCGVIPRVAAADDEIHSVELVRQAARQCAGTAVTFYAPLVVPDVATASTLRRQPGIADALRYSDQLSAAVIAIGQWESGASTVHDALAYRERAGFARKGAVAETAGMLFTGNGRQLREGLQKRVIAVTERQLRRTPEVVAVVSEPERAPAIRALMRSGLVSTLITHEAVARRLIADVAENRPI
jgi:DNA-binding transcriptional regulator LsrR (DeoR family)